MQPGTSACTLKPVDTAAALGSGSTTRPPLPQPRARALPLLLGSGPSRFEATRQPSSGPPKAADLRPNPRPNPLTGTVLEGHFECGEITNLALSNASFSTGIDERGRRIRMFTATLTCERATRANLASCVYEGETAPASELPPGASLSTFARIQMPGRMRHGAGRIRYECGNVYTGQWQHDRRSGSGTYWYACGDAYEGEWCDGMYHGHGKYTGSEVGGGGDSYEGEWSEDRPHGAGRYMYRESGAVYDGQWNEGAFHGTGTYTKADGSVTEGMWRDGLLIPLWQR